MSIFLKWAGIEGEVSDPSHQGWLDIDDLSWGVQRAITSAPSTRKDRESANAEITDLTITRRMDKASPSLFMAACCGKGQELTLHLTKTGSGQGSDVFMAYTLSNALVRHYRIKARRQGQTRPLEQIIVSFEAIEAKYTPYDDDGIAEAPIAVGFDTSTNEKR